MVREYARRLGVRLCIAALALIAALTGGGCATGTPRPDSNRTPAENLQRLADAESRSRRTAPTEAPIPPGVEPEVLRARAPSDTRAWFHLETALRHVSRPAAVAADGPPQAFPLDAEARTQALRHYVKGRDAALRNRHFVAITELEKAAAIDRSSADILRQLARSYLAMHNSLKAAALYEELLAIEPHDGETLFMLGLSATNRRDFERAASYLARPRLWGGSFDHDPAAAFLGDYMLASALRQLGYDRAWIELGRIVMESTTGLTEPTIYSSRVESLYRQRAGILRGIADAQCRLGEYEGALEAYRRSAELPAADPAALHPRVLYANLRLGRVWGAQLEMLAALEAGGPGVSDRDIRLCGYLAEAAGPVDLLAEAVVDRHRAEPDDPSLVRAAAVLLPQQRSVRLLREFLERRPGDFEVFSQLLRWLVVRDAGSAADVTVSLAAAHPLLGVGYGDALAMVGPSAAGLLETMESMPASAARATVIIRLLIYLGADGRAWNACVEAIAAWPDDQPLRIAQIEIAARLGEPRLLDEAIEAVARYDDAPTWLARSRARRALGQTGLAIPAADIAAQIAPADPEVWVELAKAHVEHARKAHDAEARRQHADNAVVAVERAVELDPADDAAYEVLFALYSPSALLSNRGLVAETREQLLAANPQSRLEGRLQSRRDIRNGRYERALERLMVLCDSDPTDTESLNLLVTVWLQLNRTDLALQWLTQRLVDRPGDPNILAQWVAVQVQLDHVGEATKRIEQLVEHEPANEAARVLLESLYRGGGEPQRAVPLAEARLLERPQGVRRELELAALFAGAGVDDEADARLRWILERSDDATFDLLVSAIGVVERLSVTASRDALVLEFVEDITERFPEAPLLVYGRGLRALARMDRLDERFDDLAGRAVAHAGGASGSSIQEWRQLAQSLVDADQVSAAGRALRLRLWADAPLDDQAQTLLANVTLVADAAANEPDRSIELITRLAAQGPLRVMAGRDGAPALPDLFYEVSIIYTQLGNYSGAARLLRETIRLAPDHPMALNNLGYTRLELGFADPETAAWIERAHELAPQDSAVLDTVGWLRYKSGRFEGDDETPGALGLIQQSLARAGEGSPEVLDHLGDTLWRLGDTDGAVEAWQQVIEILRDSAQRNQGQQDYVLAGLRVADLSEIYDRLYGGVLSRTQDKLREAGRGGTPPVAETFAEMGGIDDGRP